MKLLLLIIVFLMYNFCLLFVSSCNDNQRANIPANTIYPSQKLNAQDSVDNQEPKPTIQISLDNRKWKPTGYRGLKIGKSTEKDVKKLLGNPIWEGAPEEKVYRNESEDEILLDYGGISGLDGAVVTIGKETRIVKAIVIYPNNKQTKENIISEYGLDFFEIESHQSICINEGYKFGEHNKEIKYPTVLVYPNKGMYVSITNDRKVSQIGFLLKCPDSK